MNAKTNKEFSSGNFINKVAFWITIISIVAAIFLQIFFLKKQFSIINLPYLIASDLSAIKYFTGGNIFDYFNYSTAIIFSIIFLYFLIPFLFIFSISPALKIFNEEKSLSKLFHYESFNFIFSSAILIILLIFTLYVNLSVIPLKSDRDKLELQISELNDINAVNEIGIAIRNKMCVPKRNQGWYGMSNNEFNLFKQLTSNLLTELIYTNNKSILSKASPLKIEFNHIEIKILAQSKSYYKLVVTPESHSVEKLAYK